MGQVQQTSRNPVAVISTMKASARSPILFSRAGAMEPMPADRLRMCVTSILCSVRKRRPWSTLCAPRLRTAAPTIRVTWDRIA